MTSTDLKFNIGKLTDDELFKKLKEVGLSVGPITSTTRSLYERRLNNYLEGNSSMSLNTTITTATTTTSATETNGSPKKSNPSTPKSSPTSTPRSSPSPKRTETPKVTETLTTSFVSNDSPTSSAEYPRIRGRAPLNRKTTQSDETKSSDSSKSQGSSFFSFLKYLFLLILFVGAAYYVLMNHQSNIKQLIGYSDSA